MGEDWAWYVGRYDDYFDSGPFVSREEAIEIGKSEYDEGFHIVEAYKNDVELKDYFDAPRFVEDAEEHGYELMGEGGDNLFEITSKQSADLQKMVRDTIALWQMKHKLTFTPWCFTNSRNEEYHEHD